jgi:hypothetical protein
MPSLFRFLIVVGIIGGLIYAGLFALAYYGEPKPRDISITIQPDKFFKNR